MKRPMNSVLSRGSKLSIVEPYDLSTPPPRHHTIRVGYPWALRTRIALHKDLTGDEDSVVPRIEYRDDKSNGL